MLPLEAVEAAGPLRVAVRLPLNAAGVAVATAACSDAAARWVGWVRTVMRGYIGLQLRVHRTAASSTQGCSLTCMRPQVCAAEEHEARKTMSTLACDTKSRAACAAARAAALTARYVAAGAELAALDAGPVDQAPIRTCTMHMHNARCTSHNFTCTMHNAHARYAAQCTMHHAQCIMHNAHCTLHHAHCPLLLPRLHAPQANRGSAMNEAASSAFGDASEADMSAVDMQRLAAQVR